MKHILFALATAGSLAISNAYGVAITDVTYEGSTADAAYAGSGPNDSASAVNGLIGGSTFEFLAKHDQPGTYSSNTYMGVDFDISADLGGSGDWTLSWTDVSTPGLPLLMDIVVAIKAGNGWGAYLFEDILFTSSTTQGSGDFAISWTVGKGNTPNISHIAIYGRGESATVDVAEPSMLGILSLGLLGAGWAGRRRRKDS